MRSQAWTNLHAALKALQVKVEVLDPSSSMEVEEPSSKRTKLSSSSTNNGNNNKNNSKTKKPKKPKEKYSIVDPYNLFIHTIRKPDEDDEDDDDVVDPVDPIDDAARELKSTTGGKLSQLTVSGLINGMAGVQGGLVANKQLDINYDNPSTTNSSQADFKKLVTEKGIPSLQNATLSQLKLLATALHQGIQTRIETDVLITTPLRIQEMLAPDLLQSEFKAIRRRVYDTVILGKGMGKMEQEGADLPTAASGGVHDVEKFKKCKSCGNNDQALFVLDRKNGDVICSNCGTVVSESLMHEGSQFRKFEGEADRNHHGDAANPLYSNAHNMSTTLGGVQMTTGAGIGGFGSQKRGLETVLRNAHAFTELNISQFGKGDRRTRTGYKDKQKKDAFVQMTHCGDALNLHEAVVQRSKELFAGFRDDRELVQQFKGVIAACLCEAFDQLSSSGKAILKQQLEEVPQESFVSSRASRRNELHHANLAGKGGLQLDFSAMKHDTKEQLSTVAQKPAASWDLDDCRSWLLEASRSIAQQWIEERKKEGADDKIPSGAQEELEGKLVEHAITICNALEGELKQINAKLTQGRGRVVTPRVNDMAKLGIKWQHSYERGSGGKGGVGGSGVKGDAKRKRLATTAKPRGGGRTAGQTLILKTAKKLGLLLKDNFAGRAIHKELRTLVGKQEAQKRKERLEEQTRQRFAQMQRKPWLQARAQATN